MSLTVSQGEGLTVITIASDPKSKWPVLCQVLSFLCCSPVCSVSQNMKKKLTNIHTALGTMQIIVGVISIVFGILLKSSRIWNNITEFGLFSGSVLVIGIMTVLAAKFPSPFLVMILNVVSAALAITAAVLYSVDLATGNDLYCDTSYYSSSDYAVTPSPEQMRRTEICVKYKYLNKVMFNFSHITLQPKTGCPLKLSRVESGQYLDGRPPGKTRFLLEEVLVRPAGGAHTGLWVLTPH
uniref:Transmembrane protein 176l.1 n=1 Tax=Sinocyclocheilus anshuiensis TaxID=1608454 RepID=A0A671L0S8_9TELE